MSIEEVAEKTPDLNISPRKLIPESDFSLFRSRNIAFKLGLSGIAFKNMLKFLSGIYETFIGCDAQLA